MARKTNRRKNSTFSKFYCTQCGKPQTLVRQQSLQRPKGHLKKLACPYCGLKCNHYEVREFDFEFNYNEFMEMVENGEFPLEDEKENTTYENIYKI